MIDNHQDTNFEKMSNEIKNNPDFLNELNAVNATLPEHTNKILVSEFQNLVKSERKITHEILVYINEIEFRRLYFDYGFSSMFEFLVKKIGYTESSAYRRLQSARLLKQVPQIESKIKSGELNLTQIAMVQTALKKEKKTLNTTFPANEINLTEKAHQVLSKISNQNQKQTTLILAKEFDLPVQTQEKSKIQKDESLKLELIFSSDQAKDLEKLRALSAHKNPSLQWKDLFYLLAQKELKKIEGHTFKPSNYSCQDKSTAPTQEKPQVSANVSRQKIKRKYIPLEQKRRLFARANNQCEYICGKSKQRCLNDKFLEIDHLVPLARGGDDDFSNLRILCRNHNQKFAYDWGIQI